MSKTKATKVSGGVLEAFAGVSEGRAASAAALLHRLRSAGADVPPPEADELKYSVRRLIRGSASDRRVAREGFFSTLAVLLGCESRLSFGDVFGVVDEELRLGGQTKTELAEICAGRVLVCGAVLRSGLFLRCSEEERARTIATLFAASDRKSYLGLPACFFVADFVKSHPEARVRDLLWPHVREKLARPVRDATLDELYCLLVLQESCPALFEELFGRGSLFEEPTASQLCDKLMNVPEFSYINHPIYETLGRTLADSKHLVKFWNDGIENRLSAHNENRVLVVLTVLEAILKNVIENRDKIPSLMGDKFVPCILEWHRGFQTANSTGKVSKHKSKQRHSGHDSKGKQIMIKAKRVFDALIDSLKRDAVDPNVKLQVLNRLLFSPGDIMFCDITNSKIIKLLIEDLNFERVQEFAETLKKVIANESKKSNLDSHERIWTNAERLRATEMLTYLINHKTADNVKWRIKNMQFLIKISLFKSTGSTDTHVSSELAVAVRKSFYRCLTFRLPKLETLQKILQSLVKYIDHNLCDDGLMKNNTKTFQPEVLKSWKAMIKFTSRLEQDGNGNNSKVHAVFRILALHCGLLLFSDLMDSETSRNSLQEVQSCYEHFTKTDGTQLIKKKIANEGEIVDDEPEWTEVLVDVFLSFLSRDSLLLRNIVQVVFRLLCEYLTPSAIGQILSILDPDEETDLLTYKNKKNDSEDTIDPDSDEENDDEVSLNDEIENGMSDDTDSESEDDVEDEETNVNDQLRLAIQKALGNAAPETDTESVDIDDMGEEEGKRIDDALSSAFRMLKQSKGAMSKKEKKNHKILLEFRIRVLDLLHIYLEKVPSMEICLGMISPLFKCLEFAIKDSTQKPLEDKVRKCLKCLTAVKTFSSVEGVTPELLADYLTTVTSKGDRTQFVFQALGDVISKCGALIARCSQKLNEAKSPGKKSKKNRPLLNIYKDAMEAFFTKRDCMLPVIFFREVLQVNWVENWSLLNLIVDKSFDGSVRQFRRNEGLELLNAFYVHMRRNTSHDAECDSDRLRQLEENLSEKMMEVFGRTNGTVVNERFFALCMKLMLIVKNYHSFKKVEDNLQWEKIASVVQETRKTLKLKNTQDYFKFCNLFKLEKLKNTIVPDEKKDSADSGHDSEVDEEEPVVNGKKKNHKFDKKTERRKSDTEVSKTESKRLRMMASSEGMQTIYFSEYARKVETVEADETEDVEMDSEKEPVKKKRKGDSLKVKTVKTKKVKC